MIIGLPARSAAIGILGYEAQEAQNQAVTARMAEQVRADSEKACTVEINERTTKKQAKSRETSKDGLDTVSAEAGSARALTSW